jgi:hypothetical protein
MTQTPKETSRRGLMKAGLRGLVGAGIVALAGGLTLRRLLHRGDSAADNTCTGDSICNSCGRLASCILPQATSLREAKRE